MKSKTLMVSGTPLTSVLPGARFGSEHCGIVEAPVTQVWDVLHAMGWADLRVGRPLMALRHLRLPVAEDRVFDMFVERAGAVLWQQAPEAACLVMVGKPWSPVLQHADVHTLDEVCEFTRPGWLKYGMDWRLHDLGDGRTLVETRTLCEATDVGARRAFRLYWALIRLGSGVIRRDMIATLRRLTAGA